MKTRTLAAALVGLALLVAGWMVVNQGGTGRAPGRKIATVDPNVKPPQPTTDRGTYVRITYTWDSGGRATIQWQVSGTGGSGGAVVSRGDSPAVVMLQVRRGNQVSAWVEPWTGGGRSSCWVARPGQVQPGTEPEFVIRTGRGRTQCARTVDWGWPV